MEVIIALQSIENLFAMPTNQSEGGNLSSSGQHSYELLICCRWDRRTAHEGIVRCVIVNDYCLYTAWPVSPSSFLSASAAGWNFFYAFWGQKILIPPNGEQKRKKKPLTIDISIERNEILNVFIIPSICSYFSLHTAIFPFSPLCYWHGAQGLEKNLSFII